MEGTLKLAINFVTIRVSGSEIRKVETVESSYTPMVSHSTKVLSEVTPSTDRVIWRLSAPTLKAQSLVDTFTRAVSRKASLKDRVLSNMA